MDLNIGRGVKSSRSKDLQDFANADTCHYEQIKGLICDVIQPLDYRNINKKARQNFSVIAKPAGLPRSQAYLLPRNDMGRKAAFTLAEGATHVAQSAKSRRAAFTLAEVLITLGIIGVVAAMTLPALIQNYQKQVLLTQLKKNYAILNQAVQMLKAHNDNVDPVQISSITLQRNANTRYINTAAFGPEFAKYLPTDWHRLDPGGYCLL